MGYNRQKVIDLALCEVGYLEKKSNAQLDDKTANAGSGNYTKYARDIDAISGFYNTKKQGAAWCDIFFDWLFVKSYGADAAKKLLCQPALSCGAGCLFSANYYKVKGQFHTKDPQPGDQIFFGSPTNVTHTGLVYKVDGTKVYTVEGNTSGASGVVANGGGVCKKSYALSYAKIYGYGRPAYNDGYKVTTTTPTAKPATTTAVKTCTVKIQQLSYGSKGDCVKALQRLLVSHGYNLGSGTAAIDGDFGYLTDAAVREFQRKNGLTVDGVVGAKTWAKLLGA